MKSGSAIFLRGCLLLVLFLPVTPLLAEDAAQEGSEVALDDAELAIQSEESADGTANAAVKAIYKCKDANGRVGYSDTPCDVRAEAMSELPVLNTQPAVTVTPQFHSDSSSDQERVAARSHKTGLYKCDGRTYCSQMTSCEEAKFFLAHCPGVKMDGGGDGVPCERQWCGDN